MIRTLLSAALLALATDPSVALDESDVRPCLNLLPQDIDVVAEVDMKLNWNADGTVSGVVSRYLPDDETGYRIAQAAFRAVIACGPYEGTEKPEILTLKIDAEPALVDIPMPGTQ